MNAVPGYNSRARHHFWELGQRVLGKISDAAVAACKNLGRGDELWRASQEGGRAAARTGVCITELSLQQLRDEEAEAMGHDVDALQPLHRAAYNNQAVDELHKR